MLRETTGWAAVTSLQIVGLVLVEARIAGLTACHDPLGVLEPPLKEDT